MAKTSGRSKSRCCTSNRAANINLNKNHKDDDDDDSDSDACCNKKKIKIYGRNEWSSRIGCCAALSLGILELKRLLLLSVELVLEAHPLSFVGALPPLIASFADAGLGLPIALAALIAIRRHHTRPCYPKTKPALRRISLGLLICMVLNVGTLVLLWYSVSVSTETLKTALRTSMELYASRASAKNIIDEIQLELQCCGFSSYVDWFAFDWQVSETTEDEMAMDEYGVRSVPYSCCNRQTLSPCLHTDMSRDDARTVNVRGCAAILATILVKVAIVGYSMTGLIIFTQIVVIVILIRIIRRIIPEICSSKCTCWESTCSSDANECMMKFGATSSSECESSSAGIQRERRRAPRPRETVFSCKRSNNIERFAGGGIGHPVGDVTGRTSSACDRSINSSSTSSCSESGLTSSPAGHQLKIPRPPTAFIKAPSSGVVSSLPRTVPSVQRTVLEKPFRRKPAP
ncbi:hypothetical protein QAD02_001506 [Eretmocerus hayati]|uniref:Uncharacterized protein n=1 Tax=Eretmocerus hayati TaxID=131215 RepID=A0ACC2NGN9_9HYME|nr:hypothetical protein QAD02_001506 [Eretmocerus hayati]